MASSLLKNRKKIFYLESSKCAIFVDKSFIDQAENKPYLIRKESPTVPKVSSLFKILKFIAKYHDYNEPTKKAKIIFKKGGTYGIKITKFKNWKICKHYSIRYR